MRENADQNNSEDGHFLSSDKHLFKDQIHVLNDIDCLEIVILILYTKSFAHYISYELSFKILSQFQFLVNTLLHMF